MKLVQWKFIPAADDHGKPVQLRAVLLDRRTAEFRLSVLRVDQYYANYLTGRPIRLLVNPSNLGDVSQWYLFEYLVSSDDLHEVLPDYQALFAKDSSGVAVDDYRTSS